MDRAFPARLTVLALTFVVLIAGLSLSRPRADSGPTQPADGRGTGRVAPVCDRHLAIVRAAGVSRAGSRRTA